MISGFLGKALALMLLLLAVGSTCLAQQTITVPDDYPTIQAAIDAAQPGDIVYIRAGRCTENITITKPLQLRGAGRTKVIIQSSDPKKDVITVELSYGNVEIQGLEVTGGDTGISVKVAGGSQAKITSIIAYRNKYGVVAFGSGTLIITVSYLIDNEVFGLFIAASNAHVWDNEVLRGGTGILLLGKVNVTLEGNLIGLCEWGIDTYTSGCGWEKGESRFSGKVTGTGNRINGLKTNLCPAYPGSPWPDGFIDSAWGDAIAKAADTFNRGMTLYNDQDYESALVAYTAGLRLLANAPFPLLEAYFNNSIGVVYKELGRYEDALAKYKSARAVYVSHGMDVDVADIDTNISSVYAELGWYKDALAKYRSARAVFAAHNMDVTVATIDQNIGNVYKELGRYANALSKYRSARAVFVAHNMDVDVAKIDQNIGNVYAHLGRYEDALNAYKSARAVYLARNMDVDVAKIDQNIGIVYADLGQYEDALAAYQSARAVYAAHNMDVDVAGIYANIGNVYEGLGQYEDALAAYQSARAVYAAHNMDVTVATIDANIGVAYRKLGRYEDALTAYRSARAVFASHGMDVGVATINQGIGVVHEELGQYEDALAEYQSARAVFASHGMDVGVATIDQSIGVVHEELGQYEDALAEYQSARAVYVSHNMDVDVATIDQNIGNVYKELGRYANALSKYRSARAVFVAHKMDVDVATIDTNIGVVYDKLGKHKNALSSYNEALDILDKKPPAAGMNYSYPTTRWVIYNNMGIANEDLQNWDAARQSYEKSIAVIESLRGYMRSEKLKTAWQEKTQYVYEHLIKLLYQMEQGSNAFPYAERCRARTFLDALYQGSIKPSQLISPEAGISSGAVKPSVIDAAIGASRKELRPNEAVLEYFVTQDGIYLWVITGDGISAPIFIKYSRDQLMRDVITMRKTLESNNPNQSTLAEFLTSFYTKLVKPGLDKLTGRKIDTLIFIPSGPLWYLPFAALEMSDQEKVPSGGLGVRSPYLVERYTIAYLPSLASLSALTKEGAQPVPEKPMIALADPAISATQLQTSSKCAVKPLPRYPGLVKAARSFADELVGSDTGKQYVYAGSKAQEGVAYTVVGEKVEVYAAHGQFNPSVPLESKLLLAPGGEATRVQSDSRVPDGNYHAWEALLTDHRGTELVVLAACESLLPHLEEVKGALAVLGNKKCNQVTLSSNQLEKIVVGDEVVGLARAFLSSGAESVLGTLWLANPTAVGKLLVAMGAYRKGGDSWAQALAEAQRNLIKDTASSNPNPWLWAPYQLIGRWR